MRRISAGTLVSIILLATGVFLIQRQEPLSLGGVEFDRVEFQLNDFTSSNQAHVALDCSEEGEILVVWDSRRQQSGTYGVYARQVDFTGAIRSPEVQVNLNESSMQQRPSVTWSDGDRPLVAWTSFGQDGSGSGIITRSTGGEHIVAETTFGNQSEVALASLGIDRAVAVWSSVGSDGEQSIYGRILDRDGSPVSEEFRITESPGRRDRLPTVAASHRGFVVAWDRSTSDGEIEGVFARGFDVARGPRFGVGAIPAGVAAFTKEFRVSTAGVDEIEPTIAMDRSGDFVIGWMHLDGQTDYDPYIRRFDRAGRPLTDPVPVCADRSGWQSGLALDMNAQGELAAVWTQYHEDDSADVMARLFASDGAPLGTDFVVTAYTTGRQTMTGSAGSKRIALAGDGSLAVSWQGDSGRGDSSAANLTLLRRSGSGRPADFLRDIKNQWATRFRADDDLFDALASPILPPVYDPDTIRGTVDPESYRAGDNGDVGFVGITSTGWTPPDPHMAVGLNSVVLCTNGAIAAYAKDGTLRWQDELEGSAGFWGGQGAGTFVFDPEAHYDPFENRYYVMANERTGGRSYFLLGISSSEDVEAEWHKYRFDVTSLAGNDIDSPNLGFDTSSIYLTADFFSPDKYLIFMIDKSSVIDGGTAVTNSFLRTGTQSIGIPAQYTDDAPKMYLLEHFDGSNQTRLRIWAINNPFGTPSITSTTIDVDPYWVPGSSRSRGTSVQAFLFEARFWNCMYIDGSIWACHHIRSSSSSTAKARWYEIEMNGWPNSFSLPELAQQGTVDGGSDVYLTFNSISADEAGNAYMAFASSSVNEYYSISRAYHLDSDAPGVMSDPAVIKQSNAAYAGDRWGDYSAVNFDPADPGTFWSHHEYTPGGGAWATWVQRETLPLDPASVASPVGSTVGAGLATLQAFPNPMTTTATLRFALPQSGDVRLTIFSADGREVRSIAALVSGPRYDVEWDGRTNSGSPAPSGVYLAQASIDGVLVAEGRVIRTR